MSAKGFFATIFGIYKAITEEITGLHNSMMKGFVRSKERLFEAYVSSREAVSVAMKAGDVLDKRKKRLDEFGGRLESVNHKHLENIRKDAQKSKRGR